MWVGPEAQSSLFAAISSALALHVPFCCVSVPVEGLLGKFQLIETGSVILSTRQLDGVVWRVVSSAEKKRVDALGDGGVDPERGSAGN